MQVFEYFFVISSLKHEVMGHEGRLVGGTEREDGNGETREKNVVQNDHSEADGDLHCTAWQTLYPFNGMVHKPCECPSDFTHKKPDARTAERDRNQSKWHQKRGYREHDKVGKQEIGTDLPEIIHSERQGAQLGSDGDNNCSGHPSRSFAYYTAFPQQAMQAFFADAGNHYYRRRGRETQLKTDAPEISWPYNKNKNGCGRYGVERERLAIHHPSDFKDSNHHHRPDHGGRQSGQPCIAPHDCYD